MEKDEAASSLMRRLLDPLDRVPPRYQAGETRVIGHEIALGMIRILNGLKPLPQITAAAFVKGGSWEKRQEEFRTHIERHIRDFLTQLSEVDLSIVVARITEMNKYIPQQLALFAADHPYYVHAQEAGRALRKFESRLCEEIDKTKRGIRTARSTGAGLSA